jgi:Ice-binding-like
MNTLGNNNEHRHLATLAYSAGRVCLALALTLSMMGGVVQAAPSAAPLAAASAPSLGTASNFAVLSAAPGHGGAVTCTNSTIIGDVGSSGPKASVVQTGCTITGTIIAPVSNQVLTDFYSAYNNLAPLNNTCDVAHTLTGTLAGAVLTPGVYCVDAVAKTGTLTLDGGANDVWIFLVDGALTGTNFNVVMINGGEPCNVTWWVKAAATLTDSNFLGTILAGAAITITRGTFHGDALAKAAVTLTDVIVTGCAASGGGGNSHSKCNQGVGNGPENCDPGNSNQGDPSRSNDENGGTPGDPGRQGGNGK